MKRWLLILSVFLIFCGAWLFACSDSSDDDDQADDDLTDDDAADDDNQTDDDDATDDDNDDNTVPPDDDDDDNGVYVGDSYPYQPGPLNVLPLELAAGDLGAPVEVTIYAPIKAGKYAVIQFQHGFLMNQDYYSTVLTHIASHGFIVVAPQMYEPGGLPIGKPDSFTEADLAAQVLAWLPTVLHDTGGAEMVDGVVGLAGHSRGGKVIWKMLSDDPTRARAVAGVDPVDMNSPLMNEYPVNTGPFGFPFPSLVLGTGYGPIPLIPLVFPACAPEGDNHEIFYENSASPAYHVIATEQGHLDMLNDSLPGCGLECTSCKAGEDKDGMRRLTAGQLVAFFRWTLQGDETAVGFLTNPVGTPTPVTMEHK